MQVLQGKRVFICIHEHIWYKLTQRVYLSLPTRKLAVNLLFSQSKRKEKKKEKEKKRERKLAVNSATCK